MAAMIGFGEFSITVSTSWSPGGFGGLPNSVMSAPAMKVRPAQVRTIAFTSGSAIALVTQSKMPPRTAALSAFTGGLLIVTMATTSYRPSLMPYLATEVYFEAGPLSTRPAWQPIAGLYFDQVGLPYAGSSVREISA